MMSGRMMRILLSSVSLCAGSAASAEGCDLQASISSVATTYEPFDPNMTVLDLDVRVTNDGADPCVARFFIAPVNAALTLSSGPNLISYRVDANRGISEQPNAYGPFSATVPRGETVSVPIRFQILAQQIVPKGDYTADLIVSGKDADNQPINLSGGQATLRVRVPGRADVSISGATSTRSIGSAPGSAMLDFGEAQSNQMQRAFINVWSNGSVNVRVRSENNGVLRLNGSSALPPIPYTANFDGVEARLDGSFSVQRNPPHSIAGASYPLEIRLGSLKGKFAGRYSDILTVSVDEN